MQSGIRKHQSLIVELSNNKLDGKDGGLNDTNSIKFSKKGTKLGLTPQMISPVSGTSDINFKSIELRKSTELNHIMSDEQKMELTGDDKGASSSNAFGTKNMDYFVQVPKLTPLCQVSHAPKTPVDFNAEFQSLLESLKNMGCRDDDLTELEKQQKRLEREYLQFDMSRRGVKMSEFSFDKQ